MNVWWRTRLDFLIKELATLITFVRFVSSMDMLMPYKGSPDESTLHMYYICMLLLKFEFVDAL